MRWIFMAVMLLVVVSCRGDDRPSEDERAARAVADGMLTHVRAGEFEQAWTSLHPAQQAIVTSEQLASCAQRFPPAFASHDIVDTDEIEFNFDEIEQAAGWELVVVYELTDEMKASVQSDVPIDRRLYVTQIDQEWHWLLSQGELATFRDGNCGIPWPSGV